MAAQKSLEEGTRQLNVKIPKSTAQKLEDLSEHLNLGKSAIVRLAIDELQKCYLQQAIAPKELQFKGDAAIVEMKWKAIEKGHSRKGPVMVARELGVTPKTMDTWLATDDLFAELFQAAHDYTSELEIHTLFTIGQDENAKGRLTALFGGLNNLTELFGFVRRDYIDKNNKLLEEDFLASVQPYVSREVLQQVAADLKRRLAEKARR